MQFLKIMKNSKVFNILKSIFRICFLSKKYSCTQELDDREVYNAS